MSLLIDLLMIAWAVAELGVVGAFVAIGSSVGLDIPLALILGTNLEDILGVGLIDDIAVASLRLSFKMTDSLLLKTVLAEAEHMIEEAYEHYTHTDEQNKHYSEWLQRENPGTTYLYGDVSEVNVLELGGAFGLLAYRGKVTTVFDAVKNKYGGITTETSDVIAVEGGL